jgi:hypothetical protein
MHFSTIQKEEGYPVMEFQLATLSGVVCHYGNDSYYF